jgi:hypothetical protein
MAARERKRADSDLQQRLQDMQKHVTAQGFCVGSCIRHTLTDRQYVITEITSSCQLKIRDLDARLPQKGTFAPDVFVLS